MAEKLKTRRWWALVSSPTDLPIVFEDREQAETNSYGDEYLVRVEISQVTRKPRKTGQ